MMVKMGIVKMMVMMKMVVRLFFLKINSTNCFCHNDLGPQGDNEKGVVGGGGEQTIRIKVGCFVQQPGPKAK